MPLVFCELALAYPPAKVSDPNQRIAAANGQFLRWSGRRIGGLGGHASVANKVLEDVELAFLAKRRKVGLRFRYAEDAVATRMYRSTAAMVEGWTKNLALLFDNSLALAVWRALGLCPAAGLAGADGVALECALASHSLEWLGAGWVHGAAAGCGRWCGFMRGWRSRISRLRDCALAPLGLPLFVVLLYRSWFQHRVLKRVSWKGREIYSF